MKEGRGKGARGGREGESGGREGEREGEGVENRKMAGNLKV